MTVRFSISTSRFYAIDTCAGTSDQWAQIKGSRRRRFTRHLQGERCYLCGTSLLEDDLIPYLTRAERRQFGPTEDHVTPRSVLRRAGGLASPWNILIAHERCNSLKGDRPPRPCELILLAAVNLALRRFHEMREELKKEPAHERIRAPQLGLTNRPS